MRSNYKKLGPYIQEVTRKNSNLSVTKLRGVSVSKEFIPSIANTIGTNMSTYKIVSRRQFAYGPVTSRNSDKISIALLNEEECIISTSYTVFEVIDRNALLPEYLMMWFRRPEFDRYVRFMSHGSVRELFNWEEMCDVELPIPSIEKQIEIVREYQTIENRINLNEQLNFKLEETVRAIYKRWFIDFEFPISQECAAARCKPELAGQPYKSSGGEMVYNEVLAQEIPNGWEDGKVHRLGKVVGGATPSKNTPEYWSAQGIPWITPKDLSKTGYKFISKGENSITQLGLNKSSTNLLPPKSVLFSSRAPIGYLAITTTELCTNQGFKSVVPFDLYGCGFVYYFLYFSTQDICNQGSGTTFDEISSAGMRGYQCLLPDASVCANFQRICDKIFTAQKNLESEHQKYCELRNLLLSRISAVNV